MSAEPHFAEPNALSAHEMLPPPLFPRRLLVNAEKIRVRDLLEAVETARGQPADVRVEVWSDNGRVGIIGPSPLS